MPQSQVSYADLAYRVGSLTEELRIARRALREIRELPDDNLYLAREIAARGLRG